MVIEQLYTLLCFVLTGIIIGIIFDFFRIIRMSFKSIDMLTYIEDFLFWCISGIILLFSIFFFNNGELRAYVFIGIIMGVILYFLTISKFLIKVLLVLIEFFKKVFRIPINIISSFLKKYIFKYFHTLFLKVKKFTTKKFIKNSRNDNFPNKI